MHNKNKNIISAVFTVEYLSQYQLISLHSHERQNKKVKIASNDHHVYSLYLVDMRQMPYHSNFVIIISVMCPVPNLFVFNERLERIG